VTLFEIVFCNSLHLLKDVSNFEVRGRLCKRAFGDVVNLLEVKDAVQNALCLVQCLVSDALTLGVEMAVQLLQVNQ